MQRIKIAKIEVKEGDNDKGHWKNFILTGEDKAKVSVFEPNNAGLKPSELREGDTLEGEIELKGKYANFISYKVIEHAKEQAQQDGTQMKSQQKSYGKSPETVAMEIDSKFRDTALMQACAVAKERTTEGILHCADLFYAWLKGENLTEKPVVKAQGKETPAPAQQEATLPIVDGLTGSPEGMPADITTGAKMASYAGKRGIDSVQFTAITQAANPNDLKTKAQLIAAWNVLAPKMKVK